MKHGRLLDADGEVVVEHVEMTDCASERMLGLLGRESLPVGKAMFFAPCSSIHTMMMQFTLDLIFVDAELRVVKIARAVVPQRMAWGGSKAWGVFEVQSGWLTEQLEVGDPLTLEALPASP